MRRYGVFTRVATAAAAFVGLATFGLTGPASAAASIGPVHDLPGEYNISGAGSLACTPGQPLATAACYMVGETGTFAYNATVSTNVVVPVTDGVVGTSVELPSSDYISYISCTSGPDCIGLGSNATGDTSFYWLESGKLVKTVTTSHKGYYWDGLSCGSASYCVASGQHGRGAEVAGAVAVMSNGAVTLHRVATVIGNGVSCYGPTSCLVVGTSHQGVGTAYGTLVEVKAGVAGLIHTITATAYLGGVTCGWEEGTCRSTALVAAANWGVLPGRCNYQRDHRHGDQVAGERLRRRCRLPRSRAVRGVRCCEPERKGGARLRGRRHGRGSGCAVDCAGPGRCLQPVVPEGRCL